jgi:hypothetical protein
MKYNPNTGYIWNDKCGPEETAAVGRVVEEIDPNCQHQVGVLFAAAPNLLEACKAALVPLQHMAAHGTLPTGTTLGDLPVLQLIAAIASAEKMPEKEEFIDRAVLFQEQLKYRRRKIIEDIFETHDFGADYGEFSGWEYDGRNSFSRTVYLEQDDSPSKAVKFYVEFISDSDKVGNYGTL